MKPREEAVSLGRQVGAQPELLGWSISQALGQDAPHSHRFVYSFSGPEVSTHATVHAHGRFLF